jgi:hypothetical protein
MIGCSKFSKIITFNSSAFAMGPFPLLVQKEDVANLFIIYSIGRTGGESPCFITNEMNSNVLSYLE